MRITKKPSLILPHLPKSAAYSSSLGVMLMGQAEEVLQAKELDPIRGKVQLIFTSPPFPLNKKKKYGNLKGLEYLSWLASFGSLFRQMLAPNGSIVIELGNPWEPGSPVMSTLALRALLFFQEQNYFHLCQEVICHNPARLPSPAQWVTVERIRLKDSYTRLWWLSPSQRPKANNKNVLKPYSSSMQDLLERGSYNSGRRPSQHKISKKSFSKDNGGAICPNVLSISNTQSNDPYQIYCRNQNIEFHPARMPSTLPEFFIKFLTDPGDIVLDPFGGSNTTGAAAESLDRHWVSVEPNNNYIDGSKGRFDSKRLHVFRRK
jgi:DNA modification methylase